MLWGLLLEGRCKSFITCFLQVYPFVLLVPLIERGFGSRDVTLLGVVSCFVSVLPILDHRELTYRFDVLGLLVSV